MGMKDSFDELKTKGRDVAGQRGDQLDDGIDRAADMADKKTGGRHTEKIERGAKGAKQGAAKLGKK